MNNIDLSIVIPTYNERENINILIPKIEDVFRNIKHEIIIVDDSSPDGTQECALKLNKSYGNIRVISRRKKEGIGAAIKEGYNCANGRIILSTDADLSFRPEDMMVLYEHINQGYDLAVGCRHHIDGSYYEMEKIGTRIKGGISKLGNMVLRGLTGIQINDYSANFRAIKKEAWQKLDIKENANIVLFEMIIKANFHGMKIKEVPVSFVDRVYGKSKLNLFIEIPKYFIKMFGYIRKYKK